jgi:hypothetical protein
LRFQARWKSASSQQRITAKPPEKPDPPKNRRRNKNPAPADPPPAVTLNPPAVRFFENPQNVGFRGITGITPTDANLRSLASRRHVTSLAERSPERDVTAHGPLLPPQNVVQFGYAIRELAKNVVQ